MKPTAIDGVSPAANPTRSSKRMPGSGTRAALEELVAALEPIRPDESFDISDMTYEKCEEFVAALNW